MSAATCDLLDRYSLVAPPRHHLSQCHSPLMLPLPLCILEASPSVTGGSTGRLGLDGILSFSLTKSWGATWFSLTRHGELEVVGSPESF